MAAFEAARFNHSRTSPRGCGAEEPHLGMFSNDSKPSEASRSPSIPKECVTQDDGAVLLQLIFARLSSSRCSPGASPYAAVRREYSLLHRDDCRVQLPEAGHEIRAALMLKVAKRHAYDIDGNPLGGFKSAGGHLHAIT